MFDYIRCDVSLPGNPDELIKEQVSLGSAQTKCFDCEMTQYIITKDGDLLRTEYEMSTVPEEKRYFYGKPEWEKGELYHLAGAIQRTPIGETKMTDFHGDISFCVESEDKKIIEYVARFTNGKLQEIRLNYGTF